MSVPTIACAIPAPGTSTGLSTLKKNSGWLAAGKPFAIVNQSTSPSGIRARPVNAYAIAIEV